MAIIKIDSLLQKGMRNIISRIGVELEGGWKVAPLGLERDGSVAITNPNPNEGWYVGEIPSPPKMPIAMWSWMRKNYPFRVNDSCGLHVHMSFGTNLMFYQLLVTPDYQETMVEYLKKWAENQKLPLDHPIWPRLRGENRYCTLQYWPDAQIRAKSKSFNHDRNGHRYTAINYCFGKDNCQTVECRVLPMFDNVEQAIMAVQAVLDITNACVHKLAKNSSNLIEEARLAATIDAYTEYSSERIR